ncbi:hypothetical protein A2U01_0082233, partial [Trifolium medium]|nr:hypothetical protein [Trifolium medium]
TQPPSASTGGSRGTTPDVVAFWSERSVAPTVGT